LYVIFLLTHRNEISNNNNGNNFKKLISGTALSIQVTPILPEKKIDCAFFMANERIYLKWTGTVIFLATSGFTFLEKG
jgi:hypothetical protein